MLLVVNPPTLTRREREVGRMLLDDHSVAEIAEELMLETASVRAHMKHLYQKLEIDHPEDLKRYRYLLED